MSSEVKGAKVENPSSLLLSALRLPGEFSEGVNNSTSAGKRETEGSHPLFLLYRFSKMLHSVVITVTD